MTVKKLVTETWDTIKENPGHSVTGAVIGTFLLPIPIVGTAVGAAIGGWFGKGREKDKK